MDITWILTAISLIGTVFNIKKKIICFYIWAIGDILWFIFDFTGGTYGRSTLDLVQIVLAICGIYSWSKGGALNENREN